jgi:hypothetical protein
MRSNSVRATRAVEGKRMANGGQEIQSICPSFAIPFSWDAGLSL